LCCCFMPNSEISSEPCRVSRLPGEFCCTPNEPGTFFPTKEGIKRDEFLIQPFVCAPPFSPLPPLLQTSSVPKCLANPFPRCGDVSLPLPQPRVVFFPTPFPPGWRVFLLLSAYTSIFPNRTLTENETVPARLADWFHGSFLIHSSLCSFFPPPGVQIPPKSVAVKR